MSTPHVLIHRAQDLRCIVHPRVLALWVAAGVVGCFLGASRLGALSGAWWVAPFLFLAVEEDMRRRRIPNLLNLTFLCVALIVAGLQGGLAGIGAALAGAGAALALLFLPFAFRWMGAGDVKAAMVLGAFWGPSHLLGLLQWSFIAGGILALGLLLARGDLRELRTRWSSMLKMLLTTGRFFYIAPRAGTAAAQGLPFAVALGLGAAAQAAWPLGWQA